MASSADPAGLALAAQLWPRWWLALRTSGALTPRRHQETQNAAYQVVLDSSTQPRRARLGSKAHRARIIRGELRCRFAFDNVDRIDGDVILHKTEQSSLRSDGRTRIRAALPTSAIACARHAPGKFASHDEPGVAAICGEASAFLHRL